MALTEKNSYWTRMIADIEKRALKKLKEERIKKYDFSVTIPKRLRQRVCKIVPYEFDEYDRNVFIAPSDIEEIPTTDEEGVRAEDGQEVMPDKALSTEFDTEGELLKSEKPIATSAKVKPVEFKRKSKKKRNWCSSFVCKARTERIKWDTKIYDLQRSIWEKSLDEQAEQLMDASAERFTDWINCLGSNHDSDISKEKLKALFDIEGDHAKHTANGNISRKSMSAAIKLETSEIAQENKKYEQLTNSKSTSKRPITVAFGRGIPTKDHPWRPAEMETPITTVFPAELLSMEKLFKGITHLRSTNALVDFYKKHPDMHKPEYLVRIGKFKEREEIAAAAEVPLYERLGLKY